MRLQLENNIFVAQIDTLGAELCSLLRKDSGEEFVWQGDERYWGRSCSHVVSHYRQTKRPAALSTMKKITNCRLTDLPKSGSFLYRVIRKRVWSLF